MPARFVINDRRALQVPHPFMHPSKNLHPPIHRSYMQIKADGCEHERYENPQIISSAAGQIRLH